MPNMSYREPSPERENTRHILATLTDEVERVIVGKRSVLEILVVALLSEGHVLVEDVPGTGKTTLARALAKSINGDFRRIQFTPDLLPSDITGIYMYNQRDQDFQFRPGPILANIVLADEINRATPRTQSALLEAMEERHVTVEGHSHPTPRPFMVLATQNPIELEGTFPLPEAQLDRFMVRVSMGYPTLEEEEQILESHAAGQPVDSVAPVVEPDAVLALRDRAATVHVSPDVRRYIAELVRATRAHRDVDLGVSPRGGLALYRGAQALALLHERQFVMPDDVKHLAEPILAHRLILNTDARLRNRDARVVVHDVLQQVPVPVEAA